MRRVRKRRAAWARGVRSRSCAPVCRCSNISNRNLGLSLSAIRGSNRGTHDSKPQAGIRVEDLVNFFSFGRGGSIDVTPTWGLAGPLGCLV